MIERLFRYRWQVRRYLPLETNAGWNYEFGRFRTKFFARRYLRQHALFRYDLRLERIA